MEFVGFEPGTFRVLSHNSTDYTTGSKANQQTMSLDLPDPLATSFNGISGTIAVEGITPQP